MSVSLLSANGEEGVVRDLQRLRSALNLSYGPLGVYVLFSNTASSRARNNTCCMLFYLCTFDDLFCCVHTVTASPYIQCSKIGPQGEFELPYLFFVVTSSAH